MCYAESRHCLRASTESIMRLRLTVFCIAACILACTSSSSDETGAELGDTADAVLSCDVDPDGVAVQYSCDSTSTSGQCVDYLEGFDTSTMDVTCSSLGGAATLAVSCDVATALGRCCTVRNGQWFVTHYADVPDAPMTATELEASCESAGNTWYP